MTTSTQPTFASKKPLGLIGRGLSYSLSPLIHNYSCQILGIEADYQCFDFPDTAPIEGFLNDIHRQDALGLNITQPYKKLVANLIKSPLKSVNTLQKTSTGWLGHSTDGVGFQKALQRQWQITLADFSRFVFFGFGGAVHAILDEIERVPAIDRQILILGRAELSNALYARHLRTFIRERQEPILVIHATSAQLDPLTHLYPVLRSELVYYADINYPKDRRFLYNWAKQEGLPTMDGLPMLIEQARASQMLWFGRSASYEDIFHKISPSLGEPNGS